MGGSTGATVAAAAGAAAARARRRVIGHFTARGAVSAQTAIPFTANKRIERRFFDAMRERGVIASATNGGYYLVPSKYDDWLASRRRLGRIFLLVLLALSVVGIAVGLLLAHR